MDGEERGEAGQGVVVMEGDVDVDVDEGIDGTLRKAKGWKEKE